MMSDSFTHTKTKLHLSKSIFLEMNQLFVLIKDASDQSDVHEITRSDKPFTWAERRLRFTACGRDVLARQVKPSAAHLLPPSGSSGTIFLAVTVPRRASQ